MQMKIAFFVFNILCMIFLRLTLYRYFLYLIGSAIVVLLCIRYYCDGVKKKKINEYKINDFRVLADALKYRKNTVL